MDLSSDMMLYAMIALLVTCGVIIALLFMRRKKEQPQSLSDPAIHYVIGMKRRGFSEDVIRTQLQTSGWMDSLIDKCIFEANKQLTGGKSAQPGIPHSIVKTSPPKKV